MDMLDMDLAAAVAARDDQHNQSGHHIDLLALPTDGSAPRDSDTTTATDGNRDGVATSDNGHGQQLPRPRCESTPVTPSKRKRRSRVGKRLQLLLIKKYVQYARQFQRLPDRIATEQLLQQGHDEFYYEGGDVSEPRLSYPTFMKLVRNRRCEFARIRALRGSQRLEDGGASASNEGSDTTGTRTILDREQQEIRALIEELDRVRRRCTPSRVSSDYDPLDSTVSVDEQQHQHSNQSHGGGHGDHLQTLADGVGVSLLSVEADSLAMVGGGETDHSVIDGELSTAEGYASATAVATGGEDVVIPRAKLDLMLRVAQETLRVQKKLLDDVRAIEQRLAGFR